MGASEASGRFSSNATWHYYAYHIGKNRQLSMHADIVNWLDAGDSAVLKLPSAVVVEEWNHILNPQHPDFEKLILQKPKRFKFDRRAAREIKS
jgi:RES domain-containing protein